MIFFNFPNNDFTLIKMGKLIPSNFKDDSSINGDIFGDLGIKENFILVDPDKQFKTDVIQEA